MLSPKKYKKDGYVGKINMVENLSKYHRALAMISLVHWRATAKYPSFSWYQDPANRDSGFRDNLNAILRHFSAHSMENYIDTEGLPHIFHMCCRAGMMVTTFYRGEEVHDEGLMPSLPHGMLHTPELKALYGIHITAEEILAINKIVESRKHEEDGEEPPLSMRHPVIQGNLLNLTTDLSVGYITPKQSAQRYTKIFPVDTLFVSILEYAMAFWTEYNLIDLLNKADFTNKEIKFVETYLLDHKW